MSWNKILLEAVTFGLDEIPVVGSLLEHIAYALWPESKEDIWGEIKDKVEQLVDKKIATDVYGDVASLLGSRDQMNGLIGDIQNYLHAIDLKQSDQRIREKWDIANGFFIDHGSQFQRDGYEILLLPLFVQLANLHVTLLRDGVIRGWVSAEDMQNRIDKYSAYVDQQYQNAIKERRRKSHGNYNYVNTFRRQLTLNVLNFRDTWKYYNPSAYPPPTKMKFPRDIYYTLTEGLPHPFDSKVVYGTLGKIDPQLEKIELIWMENSYDGYNFLQGFISKYASGTTEYNGIFWDNQMPNYKKKCDPNYNYYCFHKKDITIQADNPIVALQSQYEVTGAVYNLSFGFKDGKWTGYIPHTDTDQYTTDLKIKPPKGYYLTSIWAPKDVGYYDGALDVLFGFSLDPKLLDNK